MRGLDPHTLHPIEAYFDVWEPSTESLEGARRMFDWVVKNRGNFVTWPGLDDIQRDGAVASRWAEHTRQLLEEAHLRGLRVGMGVQLFGRSNLQKAFDLLDADSPPERAPREVIRERLELPFSLGFDSMTLSFGEFSTVEPQTFIERVNETVAVGRELWPGLEVTGTVHVGKHLEVTHEGKTLPYYFLVEYVDPSVVPFVHTVMYYNLFEDAGGAYEHDDFAEHRELLLRRLREGKRAAYFPESAYWISFDNPLPAYLPLYGLSRHLDLKRLREEGVTLTEHTLFSSGWEWGYWQTDALVLRMGYQLPETFEEGMRDLFRPLPAGDELARAVAELALAQHTHLLQGRLAAYLAGDDALIELGRDRGLISQPLRPRPKELAGRSPEVLAAFEADVLGGLASLAEQTVAAQSRLTAAAARAGADGPFVRELQDAFALFALRARYAHAVWSIPVAVGRGVDAQPFLEEVDRLQASARAVIARRHQALHDPRPERLLRAKENATLYPYGYLHMAQTACYWERERVQMRRLVGVGTEPLPGCVEVDLE